MKRNIAILAAAALAALDRLHMNAREYVLRSDIPEQRRFDAYRMSLLPRTSGNRRAVGNRAQRARQWNGFAAMG